MILTVIRRNKPLLAIIYDGGRWRVVRMMNLLTMQAAEYAAEFLNCPSLDLRFVLLVSSSGSSSVVAFTK